MYKEKPAFDAKCLLQTMALHLVYQSRVSHFKPELTAPSSTLGQNYRKVAIIIAFYQSAGI